MEKVNFEKAGIEEVANVGNTTITKCGKGYTVFIEGEEVYYPTLEEAYSEALKQ